MLDSIWTVFLAPHALNWAQWYVLLFLKCKTKYWTAVPWVGGPWSPLDDILDV